MTAINVVRFRVKAGMEDAFLDAHCAGKAARPGLQGGRIVKSGERSYVLIGEWPNAAALAQARAAMIGTSTSSAIRSRIWAKAVA